MVGLDQLLSLLAQSGVGQLVCSVAALVYEKLSVAEGIFDIKQFFRTHFHHLALIICAIRQVKQGKFEFLLQKMLARQFAYVRMIQ